MRLKEYPRVGVGAGGCMFYPWMGRIRLSRDGFFGADDFIEGLSDITHESFHWALYSALDDETYDRLTYDWHRQVPHTTPGGIHCTLNSEEEIAERSEYWAVEEYLSTTNNYHSCTGDEAASISKWMGDRS